MTESEVVKIVINELQERNLIKKVKDSYKNTEYLLNNFDLLNKSISDMKLQIEDLKTYGIRKSGKAAVVVSQNMVKVDEDTIIEQRISELKQAIHRTKSVINSINHILQDLKSDKYYQIIDLKYFKKLSHEEIAEILECDVSTVSRNRNRLINLIKVRIFPNSFVDELGY